MIRLSPGALWGLSLSMSDCISFGENGWMSGLTLRSEVSSVQFECRVVETCFCSEQRKFQLYFRQWEPMIHREVLVVECMWGASSSLWWLSTRSSLSLQWFQGSLERIRIFRCWLDWLTLLLICTVCWISPCPLGCLSTFLENYLHLGWKWVECVEILLPWLSYASESCWSYF